MIIIKLDKSKLEVIENARFYNGRVYKLPFELNGYSHLGELYNKNDKEYWYSVGIMKSVMYFPQLYFKPSKDQFEINENSINKDIDKALEYED